MIQYVLTISMAFSKKHPQAGLPTFFATKIEDKVKLHTLRGNYKLWAKRFKKIDKGEAFLSVRCWTGKPYNSKQTELFKFFKKDGIGIEKILFDDWFYTVKIGDKRFTCDEVAKNDGLSTEDLEHWFKGYNLSEPMVIIHFTPFRYSKK